MEILDLVLKSTIKIQLINLHHFIMLLKDRIEKQFNFFLMLEQKPIYGIRMYVFFFLLFVLIKYFWFFKNESPYDLVSRWPVNRHLIHLFSQNQFSNDSLPKWLKFSNTNRRLGTKCLPYLIIIIVACIFQFNFSLIYKGVLIIALILLTRGYIM